MQPLKSDTDYVKSQKLRNLFTYKSATGYVALLVAVLGGSCTFGCSCGWLVALLAFGGTFGFWLHFWLLVALLVALLVFGCTFGCTFGGTFGCTVGGACKSDTGSLKSDTGYVKSKNYVIGLRAKVTSVTYFGIFNKSDTK